MAGIRERDKRTRMTVEAAIDETNVPYLFQVRNMFFLWGDGTGLF